ncbi:hypothetical protein C8F04DRAFT_1065458 [Mycena alexandri]|uniref:Mitochondrial intermembrane space import and assembly protein 40 n=1 Tax=Mycena alexandri TaxID=1745969 RepID=A0AAD6XF24_9AGAR|nr:hypothetical protein C8F04DRAFT_1065458 [Mycena alexandri]
MLRLSRARLPFRRYIQTQSFTPPSRTAKYALAVGTFAAAAYLGTRNTQADSEPSNDFRSPPPLIEDPPDFQTFLLKRVEQTRTTVDVRSALGQGPPEPDSLPTQAITQTDAEAEASGGDSGGGAFNPETGEFNWDCPCLGGMAHGPCGPEFRAAFSCFVHSEDEPKGINCVEKFQGMQNCFREHPEVYASEIADDEAADAAEKEAEAILEQEKNSAAKAEVSEAGPSPTSPSKSIEKPAEEAPSSEQ